MKEDNPEDLVARFLTNPFGEELIGGQGEAGQRHLGNHR